MRIKGLVAAVVLLAAAAMVAAAQDGLTLRYQYKAGTIDKYTMRGTFNGTMSGAGGAGEAAMPISVSIDGAMTIKTTAVSDAGVASQQMTVNRVEANTDMMGMAAQIIMEGGKVTVLVNGQPMEMPEGMPGMDSIGQPIGMKIDSRGRVLELNTSSMGEMFGGFDPSMMQQTSVAFPEGPVTPGQTWSNSVKLPMKVMGQDMLLALDFSYTFVGTEKYKGVDVARINLEGRDEMRPAAGGSGGLESMKQTFSGYELFDYSAGRAPYGKITMNQVATVAGGANQAPMTMNIAGDLEILLQ